MNKWKPQLTTITVLHYNRPWDLNLCLDSILRNTSLPFEILLVDNGSTDPEAKSYVRSLEYVTLIDLPENIVPESASAMAIAVASGEYIVGVSDDIIVTPGWLERFIRHLTEHPNIGLIGPRSNFVSGPQIVQGAYYRDILELEKFATEWSSRNTGRLTPYSRLVGFCWCCHREVIEKIGYLDPSFGFGFSDDDFSLRANLAGFKTAIAQDVFIHHTGGPQGKGDLAHQKMLMEAWAKFKEKWGLPSDMPLSKYRPKSLLNRPFDPNRDYIPLPDLKDVEPYVYKKAPPIYPDPSNSYAQPASSLPSTAIADAMAHGLAAYYLGRLDDAVEIFRELSTGNQDSFHVQMALGCSLAKTGRMDEAISHLRNAMDLQPNSCRPGNALGRALLLAGQGPEAENAFKEADKVSLYSLQAKFNLVRYYISEAKQDMAIEIATEAYHRQPQNSMVMVILSHLLVTKNKYEDALTYLKRYNSIVGSNLTGLLLCFRIYCEKRKKTKALEALKSIKSLAKKDKDVAAHLSILLGGHQDFSTHGQAFQNILAASRSLYDNLAWEDDFSIDFLVEGDILNHLHEYGKSLYEQKHVKEAIAIYETLHKLAPEDASIHNDLAAIFWEQGDINRSIQHISQANKLNPWDKDIVWNGGQIMTAIGRPEMAVSLYEQYLKYSPGDTEIAQELQKLQASTL